MECHQKTFSLSFSLHSTHWLQYFDSSDQKSSTADMMSSYKHFSSSSCMWLYKYIYEFYMCVYLTKRSAMKSIQYKVIRRIQLIWIKHFFKISVCKKGKESSQSNDLPIVTILNGFITLFRPLTWSKMQTN